MEGIANDLSAEECFLIKGKEDAAELDFAGDRYLPCECDNFDEDGADVIVIDVVGATSVSGGVGDGVVV